MSQRLSRRDFLQRSAGAAATLSGAGLLLSACGNSAASTGAAFEIPTPNNPVRFPFTDDNPSIESGLEPEAGPLKVYNWDQYIYKKVVKEFEKEYGVSVEISTFYNMSEGVAKLRTGQLDFDVFFPTLDFAPKLVAAKMLQPLNHDYLPNVADNVWPQLADPFYDRGSRFTVPYVVYGTGLGWRVDLIDDDITGMDNPYEALWNPDYTGKVGIYDDYREALAMALLKNGIRDINTEDPEEIDLAKRDLIEMTDAVNVRTTINGAYQKLPEGEFGILQAWSGDIIAAPLYFPEGNIGDPKGLLRYWWPEDGKGSVGNDLISIPIGARNPVLAHHFLNFFLDNKHAVDNFSWVGYQPPLKAADPDRLVEQGLVLPHLRSAISRPEDFDTGYRQLALPVDVDVQWQDAWADFKSGT